MKKVVVKKMEARFECRPGHDKNKNPVWRCGNCLRGHVKPAPGAQCKICRAEVIEVVL